MKLRSGKIVGEELPINRLHKKLKKYLDNLDIILQNNPEFEVELLKHIMNVNDIDDIDHIKTIINQEYNYTNDSLADLFKTCGKMSMLITGDHNIYEKYDMGGVYANQLKELIGEHLEINEN